ncbi:MAG: KilA-N domain-containing protein [Microcoleus sp.]
MTSLSGKDRHAIAFHQLGSVEFYRSGAYCNLNDIAKPFGKRVDNWMRLKETTSLMREFSQDPSYDGVPPIRTKEGRGGGTFAHPDIAIQFAQWCSPGFALWVSRQIRHLLTYGEVNLHYREWTLDQHQQGIQFNRDDIHEMYG